MYKAKSRKQRVFRRYQRAARTTGQGGRHGDEVAGRKKKPGNEARATPSLGYTVFKVVVPLA